MAATHLHVVGCPRSGTTLIAEMLIACYPHDAHCEHEQSIFKLPAQTGNLYLSKQPNDALWIAPLLARDPNLHIIAMLRDPRAVVCSMHRGWPGMYFCNYPVWKRAALAVGRSAAHPQVLVIRYEDLVADPAGVQRRVGEKFSFLRPLHAFADFHEIAQSSAAASTAMGGVRRVDVTRINGWHEHLPRLKQQIQLYPSMAADLVHHGYERDTGWLALLDNVQRENFPCRYSESRPFVKNLEQRLRVISRTRRYLRARGLARGL